MSSEVNVSGLKDFDNRITVLDRGYVELIDYMGDDNAVVDAARVSFAKSASNYTKDQNDKLTQYLINNNHGTPFEMVVFKFRVKAPVVVWWHWVRHRIASYNFVSGRYVPFDEKEVYRIANNSWRLQSKNNKQGSSGEFLPIEIGISVNRKINELFKMSFEIYDELLDYGVAKEQARLVLPFASVYYEAIVLMNARSLRNFLSLRQDSHAQSEIQDYANAIRKIVSQTHPRIFNSI